MTAQAPDQQAQARVKCPHPNSLLGGDDWEIIAGRIGDALITCEGRRAVAVAGFDAVTGRGN